MSCERENRGPSTDPDAPDGTLLRAKPDNGLSNKIAVDFQGDDFDERTSKDIMVKVSAQKNSQEIKELVGEKHSARERATSGCNPLWV